jgi:hypothetical protein
MTYLELVNAVLRRLRQDTVTSVAISDYSRLIGEMVNEAKREVEDSWNWSHLRESINITTSNADNEYVLTGSLDRTKILSAYNATSKWELGQYRQNAYLDRLVTLSPTSGSPTHFDVKGVDATTNSLNIRVWPTPTGVETLTFYVVNPQADLSADADVLLVPSAPVIQGAYLRAINERGEDQGRLSEIQESLYRVTLGDAIAIDAAHFVDETTWHPI